MPSEISRIFHKLQSRRSGLRGRALAGIDTLCYARERTATPEDNLTTEDTDDTEDTGLRQRKTIFEPATSFVIVRNNTRAHHIGCEHSYSRTLS